MADKTAIEWSDATWNVITGCSVVSPGCTNCYAMKLAGGRLQHHPSRAGLTEMSKAGPVWNGEVRFNDQWLDQPLRWRKPRRIFTCAHGDLFHESVPDEWIDRVFAVMALAPQHTFQVLTKRAERMRIWFEGIEQGDGFRVRSRPVFDAIDDLCNRLELGSRPAIVDWPLPNVWLGVSVEDQARADERMPLLMETPAAVRFVSYEPALGPVDLSRWMWPVHPSWPSRYRSPEAAIEAGETVTYARQALVWAGRAFVNWVIVGGESGPDARPFDLAWARSIVDQCRSAGVACFVKQFGSKPVGNWGQQNHPFGASYWRLVDKKGGNWSEWPDDLRVREFPYG